ncbi:MAG: hypothetical protein LBF28_03560 [Rickettsiales bacterium]|jgi:aspartyl/asparaginyl-tRNA synthetase|nr:hypothetical protein [Rickettsiales bacterium]
MKLFRTHIAELSTKIGETITIMGHAQTIRAQSGIVFIVVRDITGIVQCVIGRKNLCFKTAKGLTMESVVKITGIYALIV